MTDRRPDIHCDGCGTYCYSLSHLLHDRCPGTHYCDDCSLSIKRGKKSGKMLDYEWYCMFGSFADQFEKENQYTLQDMWKIRSFGWTSHLHAPLPKETSFDGGEIPKMSVSEWREVSVERLRYFKQFCDAGQLKFLQNFIAAVQ